MFWPNRVLLESETFSVVMESSILYYSFIVCGRNAKYLFLAISSQRAHLWDENEAEGNGRAKHNQQRDDSILHVRVELDGVDNGHSHGTGHHDVVDRDADVPGVVERRDVHGSCFPGKKCSERQHEAFVRVDDSRPESFVLRVTLQVERLVLDVF